MKTKNKLWGAQTELAIKHFNVGNELMPRSIIYSLVLIKKAAAIVNSQLGLLSKNKAKSIVRATDEILAGKFDDQFPLMLWQSGSGTQTNMNVNEVIANLTNKKVHPNDDVNMAQSTNDTFPTAMHIAASFMLKEKLLPALIELRKQFALKQKEFRDVMKIGRTHLQDAVPLTLGQEFSGYVAQLDFSIKNIKNSLHGLKDLAIGGTAVGTGLNANKLFGKKMARELSQLTGVTFVSAPNKFAALAAHDALQVVSGALKTLATALYKIVNDIRFLSSGPNCGLGELILPSNEPGSSIMPGKVNPTQCEMLLMICAQVIGNDAVCSFANSQGNFELNVFKPVIIYNLLQAINLLADGCYSFAKHAIGDLRVNLAQLKKNVASSLMLVTALNPIIGYDRAAAVAHLAQHEKITLREACLKLEYLTGPEFDKAIAHRK